MRINGHRWLRAEPHEASHRTASSRTVESLEVGSTNAAAAAAAPREMNINGVRWIRAESRSMRQVGATEEVTLNRGLAGAVGGGEVVNLELSPEAPSPGSIPPQLTPNTPASKRQRLDMTAAARRRLYGEDEEEDAPGPSTAGGDHHWDVRDLIRQSNGLAPGESGHPATKDLGNQNNLAVFLESMRYAIQSRVIYRSDSMAEVLWRVDDRTDTQYIIDLIMRSRDMLGLAKKPYVKLEIQAGLILRKEIDGQERLRYFVPGGNLSIFESRTMLLFPNHSLQNLRNYFDRLSLHERVLQKASTESKESLLSIVNLFMRFYYPR
jgi:hypothetical protein